MGAREEEEEIERERVRESDREGLEIDKDTNIDKVLAQLERAIAQESFAA